MIPAFLRWLSLSFCLLLSWGMFAVPQTRLPQPALTIQTEAAGEKEAQLQSAETLNKKKTTGPSTPLATGGVQPVLALMPDSLWNAVPVIKRAAQVARPKILAVPVGRLAPPFPVWII